MRAIISRFAPAPTGYLHLGHVVNAACVWGVTQLMAERSAARDPGRVLLRIEDHDRQRSRHDYEDALLEDLAWLGFVAHGGPVRQSDRDALYASALDTLRSQGRVYACACSRAEIANASQGAPGVPGAARAAGAPGADDQEPCYPGTCRERGLAEMPGRGLRVRLDPSVERFVDLRHGPQTQRPSEQCGDMLVRDRDGNWTYQFAVTVDDAAQEVTLVVRGDDLLESTGRQLQLARLLGRRDPPRFLHHPLILKSPTQKLSKADGDAGVRELRGRGWTAENVIGRAAALAGLLLEPRPVHAREVSSIMAGNMLRWVR
jgi:glutamyl-tRNA synthetase/glutamyl-Q tRNA(Asp) synthetase